jgi:hypothetical protein
MQPTYSTSDLARLTRGEHERALREAHYNRLESDRVSFVERTTAVVHQTRTMAAAGLAAAALIVGVVATLH